MPDIFLTSNLPIDKYAAKGVIADLNTFMDGGNGLSRDYFVPQVMSALEKDGKLYVHTYEFGGINGAIPDVESVMRRFDIAIPSGCMMLCNACADLRTKAGIMSVNRRSIKSKSA